MARQHGAGLPFGRTAGASVTSTFLKASATRPQPLATSTLASYYHNVLRLADLMLSPIDSHATSRLVSLATKRIHRWGDPTRDSRGVFSRDDVLRAIRSPATDPAVAAAIAVCWDTLSRAGSLLTRPAPASTATPIPRANARVSVVNRHIHVQIDVFEKMSRTWERLHLTTDPDSPHYNPAHVGGAAAAAATLARPADRSSPCTARALRPECRPTFDAAEQVCLIVDYGALGTSGPLQTMPPIQRLSEFVLQVLAGRKLASKQEAAGSDPLPAVLIVGEGGMHLRADDPAGPAALCEALGPEIRILDAPPAAAVGGPRPADECLQRAAKEFIAHLRALDGARRLVVVSGDGRDDIEVEKQELTFAGSVHNAILAALPVEMVGWPGSVSRAYGAVSAAKGRKVLSLREITDAGGFKVRRFAPPAGLPLDRSADPIPGHAPRPRSWDLDDFRHPVAGGDSSTLPVCRPPPCGSVAWKLQDVVGINSAISEVMAASDESSDEGYTKAHNGAAGSQRARWQTAWAHHCQLLAQRVRGIWSGTGTGPGGVATEQFGAAGGAGAGPQRQRSSEGACSEGAVSVITGPRSHDIAPEARIAFSSHKDLLGMLVRELREFYDSLDAPDSSAGVAMPLAQFGSVVVDEAHERSLELDLLLGCLAQVLRIRNAAAAVPLRRARCSCTPLRLVICSATMDESVASRFLDSVTQSVHVFVDPRKLLLELADHIAASTGIDQGFADGFSSAAKAVAVAAHTVQLFTMQGVHGEEIDIHPRSRKRTIILATSVAESCVTIPDLRVVIDSGEEDVVQYNPSLRVEVPSRQMISRASAMQRRGRCGRTRSGRCIHLYSKAQYETMNSHAVPGVLARDLTQAMATLLAAGIDPAAFHWMTTPPPTHLAHALDALASWGACTFGRGPGEASVVATAKGRLLGLLGASDPTDAAMVVATGMERQARVNAPLHAVLRRSGNGMPAAGLHGGLGQAAR
ncbi:hypothetical protein FNF28_07841 [Cafeteria roenbergensis]|uniref:Helicase C-terminal domain-containing protein n=1 Tax=Cafeteria roenbergensis TaxID=33653 RepID=A0A5A8BYV1_CAFRO|nr:hypothetical protein FNF28_07841 [Cafeteria roenbergensis]